MKQPNRYPFGTLRPATEKEVKARWSGGRPGEFFRCYFCGHKFKEEDLWRSVYTNDIPKANGNPLVCENCDGDDVVERWISINNETLNRYWWLTTAF